jgi:hypothetical protein
LDIEVIRRIVQISADLEVTIKRQILVKEKWHFVAERQKSCQEITKTWNY